MTDAPTVDWAKHDGLVPCIAQDAATGRVLMMAWMNEEALERTLATGQLHYWSRSRSELWRKGATSGHTQALVSLSLDCDSDALLALVRQEGPACHTGTTTCWTDRQLDGPDSEPVLPALARLIAQRAAELPAGSWTTRLLTEGTLAEEKVSEEAAEVVARAQGEGDDSLAHELADLWYHSLVLAAKHGVTLDDVLHELVARRG